MSIEITITDNEFQDFIIHSERYALRRNTYIVSNVHETIKKYFKRLSNNTLSVLIRDIENELPYDMPLGLLWRLKTERGKWLIFKTKELVMSNDTFMLIIAINLSVIQIFGLLEKLYQQKLAEDEMLFELKIWLMERGRNV